MVTNLKLHTGAEMPSMGLGMWKVPNELCASSVKDAVEAGYRHFDCACDYGNEVEVGDGLSEVVSSGMVAREDLWITSKLWNTYHRSEHIEAACKKTLQDLKLDYVDLYLIHFPLATQYVPFDQRYPPGWFFDPDAAEPKMQIEHVPISETWAGMEKLKASGLVKDIGVCNFGTAMLRDLLSYCNDAPSVLQVESHPYLTQDKLLRFCNENDIVYTAFSPLGALSYHELGMAEGSDTLLEHETVTRIAAVHDRTAAQVLLRWGVQRGTSVIPKTSKKERLAENISVYDFELSAHEMLQISALDEGRRYNDPGVFGEAAFNTFAPIYD